jgi:hypothetical protein
MGYELMFYDKVTGMYGKIEIYRKYKGSGRMEKVYEGQNAISYRAKTVMSRILAGGLLPNNTDTNAAGQARDYLHGSTGDQLRVSGIALGNGGHLIYETSSDLTTVLPKASGIVVDPALVTADTTRPAMPRIAAGQWGYASSDGNVVPGTSYEPVENGNIPWDGTTNITDNGIGVLEPNTTLYSECIRIPLDDVSIATDGYSFPTNTEVQFKATLDDAFLNYTGDWGFAQQAANGISEAGLICGYRPDETDILTGQVYSEDGNEPGAGAIYNGTNFQNWDTKDGNAAETKTSSGAGMGLDTNGSTPSTVVNGVDTYTSTNTWNMLSRKTFPVVPKSSEFALVFVWTIGF